MELIEINESEFNNSKGTLEISTLETSEGTSFYKEVING